MKIILAFILLTAALNLSAQQRYTFVFLNKKPDAEQISKAESDSIMKGHMANIERLAKEGKLLAAGPFHGGGGIFVFNTSQIEEAKTWLSTDPGVKAKRWDIEVLPYMPRVRGICPVGETYEMTTYSFVRFNAVVSKFTAGDYPAIIKKHDDYLKKLVDTGNVVTEAIFSERDGGILVMKGEVDAALFENDPGVQEGLIDLTIKKLYIARGSFCEK